MRKIKEPYAPVTAGNVIYQVTLASGMIITNPSAFPETLQDSAALAAIITESGEVLAAPWPIHQQPVSRPQGLGKAPPRP